MGDYSELKRLASAAKNWGGEIGESRWYEAERFKQPYFSVPDAEFLGACEPGTILALIAEIEFLTESRQEAREERNKIGDRHDAIEAERDQLKAEIEALRKDAERYRWLRKDEVEQCRISRQFSEDRMDAEVDAAMGKGELHD